MKTIARGSLAFLTTIFLFSGAVRAQDVARDDSAGIEKRVLQITAEWENFTIQQDADAYARQIVELVNLGPVAVPSLSAALDRATQDIPLRLIPFTLRAIGDAHAVPALIRALPKTLRPAGSDYGVVLTDPTLLRFMQANEASVTEGHGQSRSRDFGMSRPVREVSAALRKITHAEFEKGEVSSTFLEGNDLHRAIQARAYYEVAAKWANWWAQNWKQFVDDPALAEVHLAEIPIPATGDESASRFPTGPNVKTTGGMTGSVLGPFEQRTNCALHLALNRRIDLPQMLPIPAYPDFATWAFRAGADIVGAVFHDPESAKDFYCLRAVGVKFWEIPSDRWDQIEKLAQADQLPALDKPGHDYLMHYDDSLGRFLPEKKATFLFMTHDGLQGILRVTAQVTLGARSGGILMVPDESGPDQRATSGFQKGVEFQYKFFYTETEEMKREEAERKNALAKRNELQRSRKMAALTALHPPLTGTVYLPDGAAAAEASVLLGAMGQNAILGDRRFDDPNHSIVVQTRDDGTFSIPRAPSAHHLYFAHAHGFAEVKLEGAESPLEVRLAPWGSLEGTLIRNGKPVAGEEIAILTPSRGPTDRLHLALAPFRAESGPDGRFTIANLPPGEFQVCRVVNHIFCEAQTVKITAGQTTIFQKGFNGLTLHGQLSTSDGATTQWKTSRNFRFHKKSTLVETGIPPNFPVTITANGQFTIEDVPPGLYEFRGELREGGSDDLFGGGKVLAKVIREFKIGGESNANLDLGTIVLKIEPN
jgi:hypothetical protein